MRLQIQRVKVLFGGGGFQDKNTNLWCQKVILGKYQQYIEQIAQPTCIDGRLNILIKNILRNFVVVWLWSLIIVVVFPFRSS